MCQDIGIDNTLVYQYEVEQKISLQLKNVDYFFNCFNFLGQQVDFQVQVVH